MKTIVINILIFINLISFGCEKQNDLCISPNNCDTTGTKSDSFLIWEISRPDLQEFISCKPIILKDGVVFSLQKYDELNSPFKLSKFDKSTGRRIWDWTESGDFHSFYTYKSNNENYITLHNWNYSFSINPNSGKTIWSNFLKGKQPRGRIVGDYFYTTLYSGNNRDTMYCIRSPLSYHDWDTVCMKVLDSQSFEPGLEPPVLWMHPNGDSILIFQDRMVRKNGSVLKFDVRAFNLTKNHWQWVVENVSSNGFNSAHLPQIKGNYYLCDGNDIHCIELLKGELLWTSIAPGVGSSNLLVIDNLVITNLKTKSLIALDIATGKIVWENKEAGECPIAGGVEYHNGNVYTTLFKSANVVIARYDVKTGREDWTYTTPRFRKREAAGFELTPLTIDPSTGLIYASDKYYVMCIRPPK